MARWAVWVLGVGLAAPPLLLGGFLVWLNAQPNGVFIGKGNLTGGYQENLPPGAAYYRHQLVSGGGIYYHLIQAGDRGYGIQWWDGKPILIDGGG